MNKLLLGLILVGSMPNFASATTYSNSEGCVVEKEQTRNGVVLYVSQDDQKEIIGYGNDYSFGDFAYCSDDYTEINFFDGSKGTGVLIACSEHQNGYKTTRGRVDLYLDREGNPIEVKIVGQIKGLFGWKQDVEIECLNLEQE